jgi:peptidoglycan/LPS O-acetylase OafA/YrhL
MNIQYRPDIDGLRAVAVLAVILFHFNIPGFSAGYVGVDIFFVISGFLITSILVREISTGEFSIWNFYERRIRRIFPMLFFTSIVFLIAGYLFFENITYKNLAGSIATSSLFFSNIFFQRTSPDYFALATTSFKPFLHTWSLSVEEQFYIFFPLLLFFLHKTGRRPVFIPLFCCLILSLTIYILAAVFYPAYVFFLSPGRAWEFLAGACIAVAITNKNIPRLAVTVIQTGGVICLLLSLAFFKPSETASGPGVVCAVISASLIIVGGIYQNGWVYRLLSWKPVVFTGKISYSLYLWHFPIYAFAGYLLGDALVASEKIFLLAVIAVLSVLSYYFVERPFRIKRSAGYAHAKVFSTAALLVVAVGGTSFWIYWKDGLPGRYPENKALEETFFSPELKYWRSATLNSAVLLSAGKVPPSIGDNNQPASFLLWGDSHAIALAPGVDSIARVKKRKGYILTRNSTAPLTGLIRPNDADFAVFNNQVMDFIRHNPEINTVILVARWKSYLKMGLETGKPKHGPKKHGMDNSALREGLRTTIARIIALNRRVVIVNELPQTKNDMRWYTANRISNRFFKSDQTDISQTLDEYRLSIERVTRIFEQVQQDDNVTILHLENKLLAGNKFIFIKDGHFIYSDAHHLSAFGAKYVSAGVFEEIFQ